MADGRGSMASSCGGHKPLSTALWGPWPPQLPRFLCLCQNHLSLFSSQNIIFIMDLCKDSSDYLLLGGHL